MPYDVIELLNHQHGMCYTCGESILSDSEEGLLENSMNIEDCIYDNWNIGSDYRLCCSKCSGIGGFESDQDQESHREKMSRYQYYIQDVFPNLELQMIAIPTMLVKKSLQKVLSSKYWDAIRDKTLEEYGNKCAICGCTEGKLHCHEVWKYDNENLIQKLERCIMLCNICHIVTHPRMASFETKKGNIDIEKVKEHFTKINGCDEDIYNAYRDYTLNLELWRTCQEQDWKIDYGEYNNIIKESDTRKTCREPGQTNIIDVWK